MQISGHEGSDIRMVQATENQRQTTRGGQRIYKIVVLGDGGVGKSALTLQFVTHSFLEYHDPTIEDAYQHQAVIDGEAALLDILDTAGQMEFTAMRDQYTRCGEGFIICYSITDRRSFEEAVEYKNQIERVRHSENIPIVLVGNKYDLEHQRKVATEEGQSLARQLSCPFYETSAALRHFVDDVFHALVREIRKKEKERLLVAEKVKKRRSMWRRLRSVLRFIFRKRRS
ncbi:GTP-binding protein Rit1-like [Limulus polyphemus]|uniref:GTP-binding protein Rit1-like n=1 Tax=Limulus polyphemus TaxID=6850 RepID=A0ABM1B1A4_LIMPO|nr:GTP-binding protein Rit1-like [Limulus polyphemus]XP_013772740.1 GTP-binding protein Rit1-like [Limulus polyphemus]XP_013772742.1 GTP-binding protein Rit1-like [Limulus polyphemus]XP_022239583.1 GTP-binding protein Rit1-like [Limulus polyphemus]